MESFSRGWNFLKQAWSMAFKDKDLLKPSIDRMQRVLKITRENLFLIGTVGVRLVTGLIGFLLGAGGLALAFAIGGDATYLAGGLNTLSIIAIAIGALVFFTFVMVASVISSYTSTAYHTCLYIWARNVEKAQTAGQAIQVAAPAPLAAVLG
ncbi:MAG: hypothetical protein ABIQ77_01885 [Anaerolineales bacterium]